METLLSAFRDSLRELLKELLPELLPERKPDEQETAAYTARQFRAAHGNISVSSWRKMLREGWGPKIMIVGAQHMISRESAAEWRKAREEEANSEAAQLEHARRVAHGKIIGKKAVESPFHISKRGARKKARSKRQ
jgi:hypothetical protein